MNISIIGAISSINANIEDIGAIIAAIIGGIISSIIAIISIIYDNANNGVISTSIDGNNGNICDITIIGAIITTIIAIIAIIFIFLLYSLFLY